MTHQTGFPADLTVVNEGVFNGKRVRYAAEIGSFAVTVGTGEDSRTQGTIVSMSYLATAVDETTVDAQQRAVIFIFNGGPIIPSMHLHLLAFGPKRLKVAASLQESPTDFPLVDNEYTVLDVADLVFFDPMGTGFSRTTGETPADAFFSVDADADVFVSFVRQWCNRHGRLASPKYIFGESYGSVRAAVSSRKLAAGADPVRLDGVFLMGQAVNIVETVNRPENVMSYVVTLPTLAALGAYHGRARKSDMSLPLLMEEVTAYAETTYLQALLKGQHITDEELNDVADILSDYTGLAASEFVSRRLRIGKVEFRQLLLQDIGLVVGGMDGRYVAARESHGVSGDASAVLSEALAVAHGAYLKQLFDLAAGHEYRVVSPVSGIEGWRWGASSPFGDWRYGKDITDVMLANPGFRLVIGVGYHDTLTTYGASLYAIKQSDWPLDRVAFRAYFGGHMAYTVEPSLSAMTRDVREWVSRDRIAARYLEDCNVQGGQR